MKLVKTIGKWEWLLGEDRKTYKRYVGTSGLMAWPFPDGIDVDGEWGRLYGGGLAVKDPVVDVGSKEVVVESGLSDSVVGRPSREIDFGRGDEMVLLGVSVAKVCRELGISRMTWYRYKLKK